MSLKVQVVPVTPYQQNCSIIQCQATGLAAIVDPGGDIDRIEAAITKMDATVEKILLTHGHLDHCAAAQCVAAEASNPSSAHPAPRRQPAPTACGGRSSV